MAKGVNHYFRDGKMHKGATHKHPDGTMMTGAAMGSKSQKLFHYGDLNKTSKNAARTQWRK
tara:strand:- start:35 stop:217 length:183 start_codon:yes stop_codon:yes gene_type:complete